MYNKFIKPRGFSVFNVKEYLGNIFLKLDKNN